MASGAWHYAEAERLVDMVASTPADDGTRDVLAAAQVHATLAHAAAVYDCSLQVRTEDVAIEWGQALS